MIHLVYGGSGSGKSEFAEKLVCESSFGKKIYLAAMKIFSSEDLEKIERHRNLREGKNFLTVEMPELDENFRTDFFDGDTAVLLECLTNLSANQMFSDDGTVSGEDSVTEKIFDFVKMLEAKCGLLVIVSGNVFEDGSDYGGTTLSYMRCLGKLNVKIAGIAGRVTEVVCGIPLEVK